MSLDLKPVQVRLSEEAYAALKLCAEAEEKDLGEKAREMLTRMLLGEAHAVIAAHARLSRAVGAGSVRQRAAGRGNGGGAA